MIFTIIMRVMFFSSAALLGWMLGSSFAERELRKAKDESIKTLDNQEHVQAILYYDKIDKLPRMERELFDLLYCLLDMYTLDTEEEYSYKRRRNQHWSNSHLNGK